MKKMEKAVTKYLEQAGLTEEDFLALAKAPYPAEFGHFQRAWDGIANDLNVSQATGGIFAGFAQLEKVELNTDSILKELKALATVLYAIGIELFQKVEETVIEVPDEVQALGEERWQAKQARDWEKADALRTQLQEAGWQSLDRKDSYDLTPIT
jgi:cysteinyl-tRNA synthetase